MRFSLGRKILANSCVASAAIYFDQEFRKSLILPPQTASVKKFGSAIMQIVLKPG